jgi:subtilisin family serine protease
MRDDGTGRISDIVKGVEWAINNKEKYGIDVINMSLGGAPNGVSHKDDPIDKAVEKAISKGISVVVAAGNSGPSERTIGAPANTPEAITVGAALNPKAVSDFSSRGPTDDNINKPDLIAPGEFIVSWAVPGSQLDKSGKTIETIRHMTPSQLRNLLTEKPQLKEALKLPDDILDKSDKELEALTKTHLPGLYKPTDNTLAGPGTSFASPEVAGIVADLRQAAPEADPAKIKEAIIKSADNMGSTYGPNDQGAGFIRGDKARDYLKNA